MLTYNLGEKNKYYKLYSCIREDILRGKIKAGERLPSKRTLAQNLNVSVVTVQSAYDQLLAEGYIRSEERSGYFVEDVNINYFGEPQKTEQNENCPPNMPESTKSGTASLFPFSVWARLMRKVLLDCGEHLLERVPCDGDPELKRAISAYLYRSRGVNVDPRRIVIGAGAEYLYGVIVQLLGRDKLYAVENPGYGKISSTYALNGARFLPVDVDERGIDIAEIEHTFADIVHVSPAHQYPTGAVMPVSSRVRLINWAKERGAYIVEDDYDSEFRLTGKPLQSMLTLSPDRVIYINTFSKSLAPSMRMGYAVLPPELYERYLALFASSANTVPLFEQKTLAAMLDGGHFERHINRMRSHYRGIRAKLLERLSQVEGCKVFDTGSGLHLTVKFKGFSDGQIKEWGDERGINVKCLSDYALKNPSKFVGVAVISYSSLTEDAIEKI